MYKITYVSFFLIVQRWSKEIDALVKQVNISKWLKMHHSFCHCSKRHYFKLLLRKYVNNFDLILIFI